MSAADLAIPATADADARPSLARLTLAELRKMVDTRAGFWLILSTLILTATVVTLFCVIADDVDLTLAGVLEVALAPSSILLPILGILLVTSEWTQRTSMITFTLVPQRSRVIVAKLVAGVVLALGVMAVCLPVSLLGTALAAPDASDRWSLSADLLGRDTLSIVLGMLGGVAFGAMLLNSAAAIVLNFVLPFIFAGISAIPHVDAVVEWINPLETLSKLTADTMSGGEWARVGTTLLLWLVAPLVIGWWRIVRGEIN